MECSKIVVGDDDVATIAAAVEEGRAEGPSPDLVMGRAAGDETR